MQRPRIATLAAALAFIMALSAPSAWAAGTVSISNEYIRITVNAEDSETGRFGVETTGGDPENPDDSELALIYGKPVPWTSYTTIRINGEDWVFGGAASKRAGASGKYGDAVAKPAVKGSSIVTTYMLGQIRATQDLSFAKNQMTGYYDTARIAYTLRNEGSAPAKVGLRLMLDTMLGRNDGAPLRAGEAAIESDAGFAGSQIPDFWQAFDSLTDPSITSQASLRGRDLTPPSRAVFSNWGAFADNLWDIRLVPGRDFTREGEFDLDSAAAMYWDELTIQPGSQVTLVTYYGLGGITVAPGELSMGLAVPAELETSAEGQQSAFTAIAYIQNTGKGPALDVKVSIELPKGLELVSASDATRIVGDMKQGQLVQLSWQVRTDGKSFGSVPVTVKAVSTNAQGNLITRQISVLSPPRLSVRLIQPDMVPQQGGSLKDSYKVAMIIQNIGDSTAYWAEAALELTGARLLPGDTSLKPLGHFAPDESYEVSWHMLPLSGSQAIQMKGRAQAQNAKQVSVQSAATAPVAERLIELKIGSYADGYIEARVEAQRLAGVARVEFDLVWEGDALELLGRRPLSAGPLMLLPDGTTPGLYAGTVQGKAIRSVRCSFLPGGEPTGILVNVDFSIKGPGKMTISMQNVKAYDAAGRQLGVLSDGLKAVIK